MSEPVTTTHLLEEISRQRAHIKDLQKLVTELAEKAATEREERDRLAAENEKLREALEKALPIVIDTLRHLRATNHKAALKVTNDLADIRTALQEAGDDAQRHI